MNFIGNLHLRCFHQLKISWHWKHMINQFDDRVIPRTPQGIQFGLKNTFNIVKYF